jgi:hypothetical protein
LKARGRRAASRHAAPLAPAAVVHRAKGQQLGAPIEQIAASVHSQESFWLPSADRKVHVQLWSVQSDW